MYPDLTDSHNRTVRYLRFSVTDRCNLRCLYCRSGAETFIPHDAILRYEEIHALVGLAIKHGIEKLRLTGGEPFARKGLMPFIERLRAAYPALEIRITTNATLIGPHITALKDLGIAAVNVSLDSFDQARFAQITGRNMLNVVRASLDSLLAAGVPFKINAVALRGVNDVELSAFVDFAKAHPVDVRFIEFMPMGAGTRWSQEQYWSAKDILRSVHELADIRPIAPRQDNAGPARLFSIEGGKGRFGLITPLSNHFCHTCNRLRVTSDGRLRTCLFDDHEYRLCPALRHPRLGLAAVERIIKTATQRKPLGVTLLEKRSDAVALRRMTAIGG